MSEKVLPEENQILILDDDENITPPLVINKTRKTVVYWDMVDYPVPKDVDVASLRSRIESILHDLGCQEVSIMAYCYKNWFSDELKRKFMDEKIFVDYLPEGDDDFARMTWILVDITCLPLLFPKPNVIVLSKHMEEEAVGCFQFMYMSGVGVLLSKTEPGWLLPDESSAFELTSLFEHLDCEKPQREDTLANSVDHPLGEKTNVSS